MTDRVLPRVNLGRHAGTSSPAASSAQGASLAPVATSSGASVAPIATAARFAKPRRDALFGTATRAGVLIGVSAAVYAVSLATVSGLQSGTLAQAVADTQPGLDAVSRAKTANDQIETQLKDADARLRALAGQYDATTTDMAAYQAQFEQLSTLVAKIEGSAAAMKANFKLPSVTIRGSVGTGGGSAVTSTGASGKP